MTPREEVKKNLERCVELVGGDNELSRLTGISVGRIRNWVAMKTDISYSDLMNIINTTAQHERERIERINNIEVNL